MEKYEQMCVVGEGSYGVVLKCRHRETGQLVAIKKFLETEDDATVRKMALREIRMLKRLRHDNLVNLIEVFRRRKRFYLVFEYLDHTLLDELEAAPQGQGLEPETVRKHLFQLLRAIEYCHHNSIIHRDVKPENVLVSESGVVKLCDLGFARALSPGEPYTEYVATRWYRAPELLVADQRYGPEVDIWAVGCLFAEMLTGEPLFPGDSDIDQLTLIITALGKLAPRHQQVVSRLAGGGEPTAGAGAGKGCREQKKLPGSGLAGELLAMCLRTEPRARPSASTLLRHRYFTVDGFVEYFTAELRKKLGKTSPLRLVRGTKSRHNSWSLSYIPEASSTQLAAAPPADSLLDISYASSTLSEQTIVKGAQGAGGGPVARAPKDKPSLPACQPSPPRALHRALNAALRTLAPNPQPQPIKSSGLRKASKALLVEDSPGVKGEVERKRLHRKHDALCLPYVRGAMGQKPAEKSLHSFISTHKIYDSWDCSRSTTPTNLPYM